LDLSELAETHLQYMPAPYPYYPYAASHAAAALYLESQPTVRVEALHSLQALATFARDKDPHLIELLIGNVAHANGTAFRMFLHALAVQLAQSLQIEDSDLTLLLPVARFTDSEETDMAILREIAASPMFMEPITAQRAVQKDSNKTNSPHGAALEAVRFAATALRDTRDALTFALRALSAPPDFPTEGEGRRFWKRSSPISLHSAFLAGAGLVRAQMQGIDLQQAYLRAATLTDAQLQNADLSRANLCRAQMFAARLQNAKLWNADLRDASLPAAKLQGADLSRSYLQGAHLTGAQLKDACLWHISIADDVEKRQHCADFTDANWWDACFTDALSGSTDQQTYTWLRFMYPQPAAKADSAVQAPNSPIVRA
jgi:uncharacterized protein YjbI with pentapeptide repeats